MDQSHRRNIQSLAIGMFQIKHGQSRETFTEMFAQTTQEQNFRKIRDFRIPSLKTAYHGSESTS